MVAPISRTEIMIGKTLGGAAIAMVQGLIVLGLTYVLGFRIHSLETLGLGLLFMLLIAIFFSGLGLTIASKMNDLHGFQLVMNFLIMPIFFLSGALFPLQNLPHAVYFISLIDPLTYGVDGLRGATTGMNFFVVSHDLIIIFTLSALICTIGTILFSGIDAS
jgi:ABC-2 type transport system permease protein